MPELFIADKLALAVCTSIETLFFAYPYKCFKIFSFVFFHFLSAGRLSIFALKSSSLIDAKHGIEL